MKDTIAAAFLTLSLVACGGSTSGAEADGSSSGAGDESGTTTAAEETDEDGSTGASPSDAWVLDFTLFVEGAIQVSGIGASTSVGLVAVVTDFERVVLIDPQTAEAAGEFSVQLGDLPQQGATEAIAWTSEDHIAVLYPDDAIIRTYDVDGELQHEVDVSAAPQPLHGAMTVDPAGDTAYLVTGSDELSLVAVDLGSGDVLSTVVMSAPQSEAIEGLSLSIDGDTSPLWALTAGGEAFRIDASSGVSELAGEAFSEVGEPSGLEALINPEGESVLAVSDDDDQYNAEPGPLRLYLLE